MDVKFVLIALWDWIVVHGLTLAALIIVGILIPRVARLLLRVATNRLMKDDEGRKSWTALIGAGVYLLEVLGYFIIVYAALKNLGVSTVGAAVPATVVSAAVGFGAQKVIGDFLAGFFIISEHQYGVGDTVSFDGTSDQVMGKVVRLTLRATQIRTGKGELITVPNSQASVTINYSQHWSRAVVDIEVPMRDGDTMSSLSETVHEAAEDAIEAAGIKDEILGEIDVLPAMSITAPTAAGLPWTVGMEVTVDVNPATQWMVQRTIRSAVITAFWDRFQAPGRAVDREDTPTQEWPPITPEQIVAASGGTDQDTRQDATPTAGPGTGNPATSENPAAPGDADADSGSEPVDTSAEPVTDSTDELIEDVTEHGVWRHETHRSRAKRIFSVGGRVRPSTTVLFIVLAVLGVIGLFSATPSGGDAGWLAPSRLRNDAPAVTAPATTAPGTAGTGTPAPTSQEQATPTGDSGQTTGTGTADRDGQARQSTSNSGTDHGTGDGTTDTTGTGNSDYGTGTGTSGDTGNSGNSGEIGGQADNGGGGTGGTGQANPQSDPQSQSLGRSTGAGDGVPIAPQGGQTG
ncbi:mechanosensitive ion channel domain-containing protein [Corynebacterium nuruki]|uniref:Mechanosensitive ion channel family protein n=1 Tax=Corynebacterium nuruki TaxID=1032851 RepID=A0A3D4T047_9CORY|nr:mechanosensitive ion channel domain-containing protein [Corynebacterium nuruki]HCT14899.1 mechanosensitive ion channel family protein [Corynebacterium nuruki]